MCTAQTGTLVSHNWTRKPPSSCILATFLVCPLKLILIPQSLENTCYFLVQWFSKFGELAKSQMPKLHPSIISIKPETLRWHQCFLKFLTTSGILYTSLALPSFQISNLLPFVSQNWLFKINFPSSCYCPYWLLYYLEISLT